MALTRTVSTSVTRRRLHARVAWRSGTSTSDKAVTSCEFLITGRLPHEEALLSSIGFDGHHQATEDEAWQHHVSIRTSFGSGRAA